MRFLRALGFIFGAVQAILYGVIGVGFLLALGWVAWQQDPSGLVILAALVGVFGVIVVVSNR